MPELPDVEGFRRVVAEHARGRRIHEVRVRDASLLRNTTATALRRALEGRTVAGAERRGKWLLIPAGGSGGSGGSGEPILVLHFGMTGELHWVPTRDQPPHPHDRLHLVADGGELRYRDQRKLQGIWLAGDRGQVERVIGPEGPDALGLRAADLERALHGLRRSLKAALMDQNVVAGLGNLLTDEILWQARLDPRRPAGQLGRSERSALHRTLGRVLRTSVRAGRVPAREGWLTAVRDEKGASCPRCGRPLRRDRIGGRRTVWCPSCQR